MKSLRVSGTWLTMIALVEVEGSFWSSLIECLASGTGFYRINSESNLQQIDVANAGVSKEALHPVHERLQQARDELSGMNSFANLALQQRLDGEY